MRLNWLVALLLVAGCARGAVDIEPAIAEGASPVGNWRVTSVDGRPVSGTIGIKPSSIAANFGCNDGRGGIRIDGVSIIPQGPFAVTEKGCVERDGTETEAARREDEAFRILIWPSTMAFYSQGRARITSKFGTIDLVRN